MSLGGNGDDDNDNGNDDVNEEAFTKECQKRMGLTGYRNHPYHPVAAAIKTCSSSLESDFQYLGAINC